jgi:hypothetical protein
MDPNVVFIRDTCPREKDLNFLSRPVSLRTNNGKRKCLAPEDRAIVHASSIGILITAGTDRRTVPTRSLSPASVDASCGRSWPRVWERRGYGASVWLCSGSSENAFGVVCRQTTNWRGTEQADAS